MRGPYGRRAMRRRRRTERGMTLIESLVSLGILSVISISLLTLIVTSLHLDKLAQERSIATSLARARVEELTSQRFRPSGDYALYQLTEETVTATSPPTFTADYGDIQDFPHFKRVVVLSYDTPVTGMLKVSAQVSWNHINQGERTHEMITYLHPELE